MAARLSLAALTILAAAALACAGEGERATPGAAVTQGATETLRAVETPVMRATPALRAVPRAGVWLIDLATGARHVLYEGDRYTWTPGFTPDGAGAWLYGISDQRATRFSIDGEAVEEVTGRFVTETTRDPLVMREAGDVLVIDVGGQEIEIDGYPQDVSPDMSRVIVVRVTRQESPGQFDLWAYSLTTGEGVRFAENLLACHCDGVRGSAWSPSGQYYLYVSVSNPPLLFDADGRTVRQLAGEPMAHPASPWSPSADILAHPIEGGAVLMDLAAGRSVPLAGAEWPVTFTEGGHFVYWGSTETSVARADDGSVVFRAEGRASEDSTRPVVETSAGVAALLEGAAGCDGTVLHHPALTAARCLPGAEGATFSADGARVAFARTVRLDETRQRWELSVLMSPADPPVVLGAIEVENTVPHGMPVPSIYWHPDGMHLLVLWPGPASL